MNKEQIQMIKEAYPKGTRLVCIFMSDPFSPIDSGEKGTVRCVDDMGTIHMQWDNGRTLGLIYGEDSFRKIVEVQE